MTEEHRLPKAVIDALAERVRQEWYPSSRDDVRVRQLPEAVVEAAAKVATSEELIFGLADAWLDLSAIAAMESMRGRKSPSSAPILKGARGLVKQLEKFRQELGDCRRGTPGWAGLLSEYSIAKRAGLIEADDGEALIEQDLQAIERLNLVLRHASGIDDKKPGKLQLVRRVAELVVSLCDRCGLPVPAKSDEAPATCLVAVIVEALTGTASEEFSGYRKAIADALDNKG
jgi:hypothetical protein